MMPRRGAQNEATVEEHLRFGRAVKNFERALGQMATGSDDGLGAWRFRPSSAEARAIRKVQLAIGGLRTVMDNIICGQLGYHEPYGKDASRFYYGEEDPQHG